MAIVPTVPMSGDTSDRQWSPMGRPEEALKALETIPLSFGRGDTASALGLAYQRLKDLKTSKQILILSDMARGDWEALDLSKLGMVSDAEVTFLRIGGETRDPNFCVKSVNLIEGRGRGRISGAFGGGAIQSLREIRNHARSALSLRDQSGSEIDSLRPGEEVRSILNSLLEKPGWIDGEVRLSGDRLPLDDIYYFSL